MTITSDSTAPRVAVLGATGKQGGSVVAALAASDKPYRIRALGRDPSKAQAKELVAQGAEFVQADIGDRASLDKAFADCAIAFSVTDFWSHMSKSQEIADGKRIADAAKAAKVDLFIYSGLPSHTKISGGKWTGVEHFDGKAEIADYALELFGKGHFANVMAAAYTTIWTEALAPKKTADGYVLSSPGSPDGRWAIIDLPKDYGKFVRAAIELRGEVPTELYAATDEPTWREIAEAISKATGVEVKVAQPTKEEFFAASPLPPHGTEDVYNMMSSGQEFGYFGGARWRDSLKYLGKDFKPTTFAEWANAHAADFGLK